MSEQELFPKVRSSRLSVYASLLFIGAALSISVFALYHFGDKLLNPKVTPQALLELKLIDNKSHPVAGAEVYMNGLEVGLTDSFGEWRDYRSLETGTPLYFVFKQQGRSVLTKSMLSPLGEPFVLKRTLQIQNASKLEGEQDTRQDVVAEVPSKSEPKAKHLYTLHFASELPEELKTQIVTFMNSLGMRTHNNADFAIHLDAVDIQAGIRFVRLQAKNTQYDIEFLRAMANDNEALAKNLILTLRNHLPREVALKHFNKQWYALSESPAFWHLSEHDKLITPKGNLVEAGDLQYLAKLPLRPIRINGYTCKNDCRMQILSLHNTPPFAGWTFAPEKHFEADVFVAGMKPIEKSNQKGYWVPHSPKVNVTKLKADGSVSYRESIPNPLRLKMSSKSNAKSL